MRFFLSSESHGEVRFGAVFIFRESYGAVRCGAAQLSVEQLFPTVRLSVRRS